MQCEKAVERHWVAELGTVFICSGRKWDVLDMLRDVILKHPQEMERQKKIAQEKIRMKTCELGPICM